MSYQADTNSSFPSALVEIAVLLSNLLLKIEQAMISAAEYAEHEHRRAYLLAAYRRRHSWKAGDIGPLNSLSPNASARKRMLYRGEHSLARDQGIVSPSDHAERLVGTALGMSAPSVHSICGEIRRIRKDCEETANFPPMTLTQYQIWMETGTHPRLQSN